MINYSGFDECASALCSKFCNALGVKHDKMMRKGKTTHLIIPNAEYLPSTSKRLGAAHDWGIKIRLPHFLRQLAEAPAHASPQLAGSGGAFVPALGTDTAPKKEPPRVEDSLADNSALKGCENGQISGDVMEGSVVLESRDELRTGSKVDGPLQGCRIAIHRDLEVTGMSLTV